MWMQGLPYLRAARNFVLNATTLQPTQAYSSQTTKLT